MVAFSHFLHNRAANTAACSARTPSERVHSWPTGTRGQSDPDNSYQGEVGSSVARFSDFFFKKTPKIQVFVQGHQL